jgi:integrase/recombinase XerD
MTRTVSLWIRPKGCSSQIKPTYFDSKQTRLKPQEGEYYLRYAGKWEAVGSDPLLALDAKAAKEKLLRDVERGVVPITEALPHLNPPAEEARLSVGAAISTYLTTGKAAQKDWRKHTLQCYALALKLFTESCQKTYMHEIVGDDLRVFKVYLRKQETTFGTKIDPRTVYNHFNNAVSFLNTYNRTNLIPQSEWPIYEEKEVVHYEPEVMTQLLKFADVEETDVLEFFLGVGFRNGEGTHIEWPDVDLRNKEVHIYSKRERFDWRVKDSQQRIIGISDRLAERLTVRRERHPGNGLVFGNSKGNPDKHLLRVIKRVALRAGLNCGRCVGTHERKRVSCSTYPVCRRWIIHTLRKTWATFQARIGTPLPTIKDDLGHSSLATTQKYLASEERRSLRRRQQINAAAALVSSLEHGAKPSIQ